VVVDVRPDGRVGDRDSEAFAVAAQAREQVGWMFRLRVDVTRYTLAAVGLSGIVGGKAQEGLDVRDDDPGPALSVNPTATAVEGHSLRWVFTWRPPTVPPD
jgi:hypothetical protein